MCVQALAVTEDGGYIVTGGFDCRVRVFTAHNMKLHFTHESFDSTIRTLHISHDSRLATHTLYCHDNKPLPHRFIFAGLASGTVAVLATHSWMNQ